MPLPSLLTSQIPRIARVAGKLPWLRTRLSRYAIQQYCSVTVPRPRPYSMAADYTSWPGLTNRTFTGRHLPPIPQARQEGLPSVADVTALFRREKEVKATDSSVLFAFFAQWFTDSFLRTSHDDFCQNTSNHEIDLCQIYGLSEDRTHMLRSHEGGRLRSQLLEGEEFPQFLLEAAGPDGKYKVKADFAGLHDEDFLLGTILEDAPPEHMDTVFAVGLEHGNSTIGNTVMNVVFLREHNRVAGLIQKAHPDWDDERLFQTARNVMIVILLDLIVQDYIMHIAPFDFPLQNVRFAAEGANWNHSNWIAIEFNLLYRWHSLVPDSIGEGADKIEWSAFRNNNPLVIQRGIVDMVNAFSKEKAGRIGLHNTPAFMVDSRSPEKLSVEGRSVKLSRDARLAPYNDYRKAFKLRPLESFEELTSDTSLQKELKEMYGTIDRLDWYVGIFAEDYDKELMMGGLLTAMVAYDAFTQALTNPLLAKNIYNEATFSPEGMKEIDSTRTLQQILARNCSTKVKASFKV